MTVAEADSFYPLVIPAGAVARIPPEARSREAFSLAELVITGGGPAYLWAAQDLSAAQALGNVNNGVFDLAASRDQKGERVMATPSGPATILNFGDTTLYGYVRFHAIAVPSDHAKMPPEFAVSAQRRLDREVNEEGPPRTMQPTYGLRESLKNG